jgi:hypothetical protein
MDDDTAENLIIKASTSTAAEAGSSLSSTAMTLLKNSVLQDILTRLSQLTRFHTLTGVIPENEQSELIPWTMESGLDKLRGLKNME